MPIVLIVVGGIVIVTLMENLISNIFKNASDKRKKEIEKMKYQKEILELEIKKEETQVRLLEEENKKLDKIIYEAVPK
jgi:cell shape-determining protein MreC